MNPIEKFFIRLALLPAFLYDKLGIDRPQLRAILTAKLTMDNRRPGSLSGEKTVTGNATLIMMASQLIIGLFMLIAFAFGDDLVTKLTFFMTLFGLMICAVLITDFTSVLIDTRDNLIILPKPVSDATFVTSRLLHIAIRIFFIALPLAAPGCIMSAIMGGPLIIPPFILMIILMTLLGIFMVNAAYLLILKITTPAKFKNIIGHIQVIFMVILMASYQILPRMLDSAAKKNGSVFLKVGINEIPFAGFIPSFWFADACVTLSGADYSRGSLISPALAVFVPLLSLWLVVKFLVPSFNNKLGLISGGTTTLDNTNKTSRTVEVSSKKSLLQHVARLMTKPGAERAGFIFTARMIFRSRDFKMKVAPNFGIIIAMIFPIMYRNLSNGGSLTDPGFLPVLLIIIYAFSLPILTAYTHIEHSDKYKASWIFSITPFENPCTIISGATKSMIAIFVAPFVIPLIILGVVFQGFTALPNLLLAGINLVALSSFMAILLFRKLPFSKSPKEKGFDGIGCVLMFFMFVIIAIIVGLQWYLSRFPWAVGIWIVLSFAAVMLIWKKIKNRNLEKANELFGSIN